MAESQTEINRKLVLKFADLFYSQKKVRMAFMTHVSIDYIQHNPNIPDGREVAIEMLEPKFSHPGSSFLIKRILGDGEWAAIHLHGRMDADLPGAAVVDIYHIENGKIKEHWDVLQPVPSSAVNPHPMF